MRVAVAVLLLLSTPASAQERIPLAAGQPAPVEGVLLTVPEARRIAETCRAAQVERDELRKTLAEKQPAPPPAVVVGAVAVAAFVAGVFVTRAATR